MANAGHNDPKLTDNPEGFMAMATGGDSDGDDTEGHRAAFVTDDGSTDGPDGIFERDLRATDDGDDTEGHLKSL